MNVHNLRSNKVRIGPRLPLAVALAATLVLAFVRPNAAIDLSTIQNQLLPGSGGANKQQVKPIEFNKREQTLEELIKPIGIPVGYLPPLPLKGVHIKGLTPDGVDALGYNQFVVVLNNKFNTMSEVYRDNRKAGRSNFVSADCILHPYLAFTNRLMADVIATHIAPDISLLLRSMLDVALKDYQNAEDAEVREDIEHNVAFLCVGIRLLSPEYKLPALANVQALVEADLKNIVAGKPTRSAVLENKQDFSTFRPLGWYGSTPELDGFWRAREWISRMSFPLTDITVSTSGGHVNNFRRSVLMYRSLAMAEALGKPATELYMRVNKSMQLLGAVHEDWQERVLYPADYQSVFAQHSGADLKTTLTTLAEPFYRTKLLLAVRRQKPMNLSSTSIFEMEDAGSTSVSAANFRLFPMTTDPELPWLRRSAQMYPVPYPDSPLWPIGLLELWAWGAPQANNLVAANAFAMHPEIAPNLFELDRAVLRRMPGGQVEPVDSRIWKILSGYFKTAPELSPAVLKTEPWLTRRAESAFAGWVDSQVAMSADPSAPAPGPTQTAATAAAANGKGTTGDGGSEGISSGPAPSDKTPSGIPRRVTKTEPYHVLDPDPFLYEALEIDSNRIMSSLSSMGYIRDSYKVRLGDFTRLFQRFKSIALLESKGALLGPVDTKLLAEIDKVLDRIDAPLENTLAFEASKDVAAQPVSTRAKPLNKPAIAAAGGFNLCLGRPGYLFIIFQNPRNQQWVLTRGAVYSYYELPAPPLAPIMWQHKLQSGTVKPQFWTDRFDINQSGTELPPRRPI